jgi:hypothetical protein
MMLTERNLSGMSLDVKLLLAKAATIDAKMDELSLRLTRIEDALGIKTVRRVKLVDEPDVRVETEKSENKLDKGTSEGRK